MCVPAGSSTNKLAVILGVLLGVLACLVVIALIVALLVTRRRRNRRDDDSESGRSSTQVRARVRARVCVGMHGEHQLVCVRMWARVCFRAGARAHARACPLCAG